MAVAKQRAQNPALPMLVLRAAKPKRHAKPFYLLRRSNSRWTRTSHQSKADHPAGSDWRYQQLNRSHRMVRLRHVPSVPANVGELTCMTSEVAKQTSMEIVLILDQNADLSASYFTCEGD